MVADELAATTGEDRGRRLAKYAYYYRLLLAGHLNRRRFGAMLGRIAPLPVPTA